MGATAIVLLTIVVLAAFTTEATAGFGSLLIALTLGSLFLPTPLVLSIVVPLEVLLAGYMVLRHRRAIASRQLLVQILPLMVIGGALGFSAASSLAAPSLRRLLGALVVTVSLLQLWRLLGRRSMGRPLAPSVTAALIGAAGFVHGIFATGGPLLVYAIGRSEMAKSELRSTLASIWLVLNSILTATYIATGRVTMQSARLIALLLPVVVVAIVVGEVLHRRIPERPFRVLVFSMLLVAGLLILLR